MHLWSQRSPKGQPEVNLLIRLLIHLNGLLIRLNGLSIRLNGLLIRLN